jgi:outer membrane immunogenic protein
VPVLCRPGAGALGVTPNVVIGVDYVHGFKCSRDITFTAPGTVLSRVDRIHQDVDMVTARLSYKFGGAGPVVAKY